MPIVAVISNQYGLTRGEAVNVRLDAEKSVKPKNIEGNSPKAEVDRGKNPERK